MKIPGNLVITKANAARQEFGWVDAYIFLIPLAVVSALILLARWSGWIV